MPTTKKRINITLSPEMEKAIVRIAKRDKVPEATKAAELIESALMMDEDRVWESMAVLRDTKKARFISHDDAWK